MIDMPEAPAAMNTREFCGAELVPPVPIHGPPLGPDVGPPAHCALKYTVPSAPMSGLENAFGTNTACGNPGTLPVVTPSATTTFCHVPSAWAPWTAVSTSTDIASLW